MLQYSPKIVTDSLVMCLDASQNKSYPTDLPVKNGLALWLDAADDSTFSYSSGTSISQWRDKSGNNRHFFQATAGNQPSRSAVVNSRKAIQFTAASSQYLRYNSKIINNTTGGSVFVAWRTAGETNAYSSILDNYHCGNNALGAGFQIERNVTNNQYYWGFVTPGCGNGGFMPATSYSNDTTNCIWITKDSTTITGGLNGTSGTPNASPSSTWVEDDKGWTIGAWGSGTESFGRFFNGINCEVIIFNRGLSPTEVKQVNTYLGQKWGISNTDRSIVDLSGNNNHGLLGGLPGSQVVADMPLFDVYNKGALKLDGSTDYISVENATSLNPTTVTVSIWIKRHGYQSSVANYLRRNYNDAYSIIGDIAADNVRFRIHNGSAYPESPNATLSLNEWTNIVGTYDLANIKIYKNGVFVGQTAHTSAISYASANTTLTIGRDDPVAGRYMNANYGSVLIYSRALSAAEVAQNYEAQKSKFANTIVQQGLMLHLDAENPSSYAGAGTVWYDVSGNGYNAGMNNITPSNWVTYNGVKAFETNDTNNQNFTVGSFPFPQSGRTYEIWINSKSFSIGWQSWFDDGNGERVLFGTSTNTIHVYPSVEVSANLVVGQWYQLLYTMVGGNGTAVVVYKDGQAIGSGTYGYVINSGTGILFILGDSGSEITSCYCSTVRVYNRVLSAAEVLQNYNATKGRFGR